MKGPSSYGALLVAWLLITGAASADRVAAPSGPWKDLRPVAEVDLSGAEPHLRQRMLKMRARLDTLLAEGGARKAALAEGYGTLAALYAGSGLETSAERCFDNARRLAPGDYRWPYLAAQLALNGGRPREALKRLRRVQTLKPDYPALPLRFGQTLLQLDRLEEARAALEQALGNPGLRAAALYSLGQIDLLRRRYRKAAERFQEALKLAPQADALYYPLAQALRALGDREKAMAALRRKGDTLPPVDDPLLAEMNALNNSARHFYSQALKAVHERRYAEAVEALRAGLKMDPGNANARTTLARALYLSGQVEAAKTLLQGVLKARPGHPLANFLHGVLLEAEGDTQAARAAYERTLRRDPGHAGAHYYLAGLLFRQGDYAGAARHFAEAAKAGPELAMAALYRLVALQRAGTSDRELKQALEAALHKQPKQPLLRYAMARLLAASGDAAVRDPARALKLTRQLLQQMPSPPHQAAHALALAASGDFDKARETLAKAMSPLPWDPAFATELLQMATAFQGHRLPPAWPEDDPLLTPPPANPHLVIAEYPAEKPF